MANLATLEAGDNFSDLVDRVATGKERIILTRAGKELVAIVPVEDLELMEATEERLDIEDARAARREAEEKRYDLARRLEKGDGTLIRAAWSTP